MFGKTKIIVIKVAISISLDLLILGLAWYWFGWRMAALAFLIRLSSNVSTVWNHS